MRHSEYVIFHHTEWRLLYSIFPIQPVIDEQIVLLSWEDNLIKMILIESYHSVQLILVKD